LDNSSIVVVVNYFQACLTVHCYVSELKRVTFEIVVYVETFEPSREFQTVIEDAQCVGSTKIGCDDTEEALEGTRVSYRSVEGLI
jgi:hypothetical protein